MPRPAVRRGPAWRGPGGVAAVAASVVLLGGCGGGDTAETAALSGAAARGERLVEEFGCLSCHSIDGSRGTGPTWKGLAGSEVVLRDGRTVQADAEYLRRSILDPDADVVEGFPAGLMGSVLAAESISNEEANAIVAYLQTLGDRGPEGDESR